MFTVTREWIEKNTTKRGGYLAAQVHALGYPWPPPKGWLKRIIGKQITLEQRDAFVAGTISKQEARKKLREIKDAKLCLQYGWTPPKPAKIKKPKKQKLTPIAKPTSSDFLQTFEWRRLRMQALKKYGAKCMCCGATPQIGAVMNVDHIKPRKLFPELALDITNLQILCNECNHGKGNWDLTDWREKWTDLINFGQFTPEK
jgi:5-methylcytosine-specific restriction endonuclease McrA